MSGGLVVPVPVERAVSGAQRSCRALLGPRPGNVELGPVAGRETDGLSFVARELTGELRRLVRVECHALAHLEGGPVMRDADERKLRQPEPPRAAPSRR